MPASTRFSVVALFAATIFLSAFLLFQVQPLLSKSILPWFGGAPSVWTACMLFFQLLLFGGYAYAHLIVRRLSPSRQMLLHGALITAAFLTLPVTPASDWKPTGEEEPTLRILFLLSATVGLPFFLLSSTGPLLQSWFARTHQGLAVYRLYALSNVGSLLALISYPFLFDPAFDSVTQSVIWSWGFGVFGLLCIACGVWTSRQADNAPVRSSAGETATDDSTVAESTATTTHGWGVGVLWFLLPLTASVLLLATTNHVCLDVAAVPFLWVVPLSLYLVTFIICFDRERWYFRPVFIALAALSIVGICVAPILDEQDILSLSLVAEISLYFAGLFFCAMVCHGELVRLKPPPEHLTAFYLVISAGGAAGGLFVGVVAPLIFPTYLELNVGLILVCVLVLAVQFRDPDSFLYRGRPRWAWGAVLIGFVLLAKELVTQAADQLADSVEFSRNFYGVLRVAEYGTGDPEKHRMQLYHGRILHGRQFVSPHKRSIPTTYYGRTSAPGLVLTNFKPGQLKHVGVVGLGVGTLAAYAEPGDRYRIYEINSDVIRLAHKHFTYLSDCKGDVTIVTGDARLSMERELPQKFDVLMLDAFSGDAIPMHLLTEEAFTIYQKHLKPDGVLLVHISNNYFELSPVVAGAAVRFGYQNTQVGSEKDEEQGTSSSDWMVVAPDLSVPGLKTVKAAGRPADGTPLLWTDRRSSLIEVYR